jgi:Protein of unknown function (DUF3675)
MHANLILFIIIALYSGMWTITGTPLDLHDPRILAVTTSQNQLLGSDYDDYAANNGTSSFFRTAALIVSYFTLK